jgi:hypothetical protein
MNRKTLNLILWLCFALGLVGVPGIYIHEKWITGRTVETISLFSQHVGRRFPEWDTPVTVHLEPSMNPIAFDVGHRLVPNDEGWNKADYYIARLSLGEREIWEQDCPFGFDRIGFGRRRTMRSKSFGIVIPIHDDRMRVFNVSEAGDYTFDMRLDEDNGAVSVGKLQLIVKADVLIFPDAIWYLAWVMLLGPPIYAWIRVRKGPPGEDGGGGGGKSGKSGSGESVQPRVTRNRALDGLQ